MPNLSTRRSCGSLSSPRWWAEQALGRLHGVGKATEEKLEKLGVKSVRDLRCLDLPALEEQFGRYGLRLYELSRGIDNSQVRLGMRSTIEYD